MSPMIAGFRTLAATDKPVNMRAAMNILEDEDDAATRVQMMKPTLHPFMTGYRPRSSERGAMSRGPAASPSSQMVTRRAEVVDVEVWPSRSSTIREAMGTTPMQVRVLGEVSLGFMVGLVAWGRQMILGDHVCVT